MQTYLRSLKLLTFSGSYLLQVRAESGLHESKRRELDSAGGRVTLGTIIVKSNIVRGQTPMKEELGTANMNGIGNAPNLCKARRSCVELFQVLH